MSPDEKGNFRGIAVPCVPESMERKKKWPCIFKRMGYAGCEYREDKLPDRAHWIPQQRIKQALKSRGYDAAAIGLALWSSAIWDWSCRAHHHAFDQKSLRVTADQYPESVHTWAEEHGFVFVDERTGWVSEAEPKEAA